MFQSKVPSNLMSDLSSLCPGIIAVDNIVLQVCSRIIATLVLKVGAKFRRVDD